MHVRCMHIGFDARLDRGAGAATSAGWARRSPSGRRTRRRGTSSRAIFGARGQGAVCWCQRYKLAPGEAFKHHPAAERAERRASIFFWLKDKSLTDLDTGFPLEWEGQGVSFR